MSTLRLVLMVTLLSPTTGIWLGILGKVSARVGILSESGVFVKYRNLPTAKLSCNSDANSGVNHSVERDRSIVLAADTQGGVRVVYQFSSGSNIQLLSRTVDKNGNLGTLQILDGNVPNTDEFSATADTNYNTHVLFKAYDG